MISHKHKTIFIHIPRTAGTSIEMLLEGRDWWLENPKEKHITASKAKELYADWWDDYFKFSIVRNPWDRVVSMYRNPNYGRQWSSVTGKRLIYFLENYEAPEWEVSPGTACQYLDEPIDYIGRFENMSKEITYLAGRLKLDFINIEDIECKCCGRGYHYNPTVRTIYSEYYDDKTRDMVAELYKDDIKRFGYSYD